jgi:Chitobiase/beta-hexosaminidase C-terminal domain
MRRMTLLIVFLLCPGVWAATFRIAPDASQRTIQRIIELAAAGSSNTVAFDAGSYNVDGTINVPCSNHLTIAGPAVARHAQPIAILNASKSQNRPVFGIQPCSGGLTIQYLKAMNMGLAQVYSGDSSGYNFYNNSCGNMPSHNNNDYQNEWETCIFINGTIDTTVQHVNVLYNLFGDDNSCTAPFANGSDDGGSCMGFYETAGVLLHSNIRYNTFSHLSEGIHFHQIAGFPSTINSVVGDVNIEHNLFVNWHRIAIEIQTGIFNLPNVGPISVSHNVVMNPIKPFYGTMGISMACCQNGRNGSDSSAPNPPEHTDDNLVITNTHNTQALYCDSPHGGPKVPCDPNRPEGYFQNPEMGIEFWGAAGATANNNYIFGPWAMPIYWGYGRGTPWFVNHNYMCRQPPDPKTNGSLHGMDTNGFIGNEEKQAPELAPVQKDNTQVKQCSQIVSIAPTISPASGSFSSAQTVTLADNGLNTSIYYTTDGTTPVPGAGTTRLYTGPITLTETATVKAVGMWGVPPQPVRYTAPYGFAPSAVLATVYTKSGS